ncbi:MAG: hypothetical protein ABIA76_02305, partial [Candidatus Diapherotrites archaeon]
ALMVFVEVNQDAVKEIISPEEQAMDLIKQDKVFKTYIEGKDYSTELKFLLPETVKEINEELGLELEEKELIQVNFSHPQLGNYTAFVDLEKETVKIYRLAGASLN